MGDLDPKWEQELGDWENMRWEHGRLAEIKVGDWEIQSFDSDPPTPNEGLISTPRDDVEPA